MDLNGMDNKRSGQALTVAQRARADHRVAAVFRKWDINYCSNGSLTLADICREKELDPNVVEEEIRAATSSITLAATPLFESWPVAFLTDYILHVHHAYVRQTLPELGVDLLSFIDGYQKKYPQLHRTGELFQELASGVTNHMEREEKQVFPYIRQVGSIYERKEDFGGLFIRTLRKPFHEMVAHDHLQIMGRIQKLKKETNGFQAPEKAPVNYQVLLQRIQSFCDNLVAQKNLEQEILFPRVLRMEKDLAKSN